MANAGVERDLEWNGGRTVREAIAEDAGFNHQLRVQAFFTNLAASVIPPHVGDQYRDCVKNILLRAQEAGIYEPEKP